MTISRSAAAYSEDISTATLVARAVEESGLDDLGDGGIEEALRCLVDAAKRDQVLNPSGLAALCGEVQRILINRLRFVRDVKANPEILAEDVSDPIVIVGLPRTGSTKLQRMLACDPGSQRLEFWRTLNPASLEPSQVPEGDGDREDPRIDLARQAVEKVTESMPEYVSSHPMHEREVDEDALLHLHSFRGIATYISHPTPSYLEWLSSQPMFDAYDYTKELLQYLQWQDGGRKRRRWILKSPVHYGNIDTLVQAHPRATVVCTYRNLYDVIPSYCRLVENFWSVSWASSDSKQLRATVGREILNIWATEARKHMQLRKQLAGKVRILDVRYEQIRDESMHVIARIFQISGWECSSHGASRMAQWEQHHPQHYAGSYDYSLEDYGLNRRDVEEAFGECIDAQGNLVY